MSQMCLNPFNKFTFYSHAMRNDSPYTPLLNASHDNHRRELLLIFSGLLLLASIIAFTGYSASFNVRQPHADVSVSASSSSSILSDEETKPSTVSPTKVSRGVSSGVSEKSSTFLSGKVVGEGESFPWDNTMLSWQRTAFHFQPENNWMNGSTFILRSTYLPISFSFSCLFN